MYFRIYRDNSKICTNTLTLPRTTMKQTDQTVHINVQLNVSLFINNHRNSLSTFQDRNKVGIHSILPRPQLWDYIGFVVVTDNCLKMTTKF